MKTFEIKKFYD